MTRAQALRAERRLARERMERERRAEAVKAAMAILLLLAAYCLVGTLEYGDRVRDLAGPAGGLERDTRRWLDD